MRCDQFMGLPKAASEFLRENEKPPETCVGCGRPFSREYKVIGKFHGMFMEEFPLHRRLLKNGSYADEFHQCAPWSSGPCHFLALRLEDGTEFTWTDEEIEDAV